MRTFAVVEQHAEWEVIRTRGFFNKAVATCATKDNATRIASLLEASEGVKEPRYLMELREAAIAAVREHPELRGGALQEALKKLDGV